MSRATQEHPRSLQVFGYRSITFYGSSFQMIHLTIQVPHWGPTTPVMQAQPVWAGPFSLAATGGIDSLSFPPLTKMFQFSGYRFTCPIYSGMDNNRLRLLGFPIRKSPGQSVFAATRGLSQLVTSFIALHRQGIHQLPLVHLFRFKRIAVWYLNSG